MRANLRFLLATVVVLPLAGGCGGGAPGGAMARIRPQGIEAHVRVLANDALEGRGTGTEGYRRAAEYVAEQFRAIGLEPGGDARSFFQSVPLARGRVVESGCALALAGPRGERVLRYGADYVMSADLLRDRTAVDAPLVFVGYGITAPELGFASYGPAGSPAGDLRGKVVVMISGAPARFPGDPRAYYSWGRNKEHEAVAHGARGILTVRTPVDARRASWDRVLRQSRLPALRWADSTGTPHDTPPELAISATLDSAAAAALFADAGMTLEQAYALADSGASPRALPVRLSARRETVRSKAESPNVLGVLRGSDPKLRDEYVVYTAHLDHLGISTPVHGDSINNGAYDNASGVAMVVEIARAFASQARRPARSLLFLAVTGEEKGMQGSDYFAHHPTVPLRRIVADINLDMFLMFEPLRQIVAYGAEHSTLQGPVARAARRLGVTVTPDPEPEEVVFVRSDQISFVRAGVPSVFPTEGAGTTPERVVARRHWMKTVYHTPQDDLNQPFDWEAGAQFARLAYLVGAEVADARARPQWNGGDFFGRIFGGSR